MTGAISTGRSMQIAMSSILSFLNVFFRYRLFASFSLTQKRCFVTRFLLAPDPTVFVVSNTKPGEIQYPRRANSAPSWHGATIA